MITEKELDLARQSVRMALESGAQQARVTLNKSCEDFVATLNGEVDRVTHCEDRSLSLALFVDGRYGSFSTNKLEEKSLDDFIRHATDIVRSLAPDSFRRLPDPSRCEGNARSGLEAGVFDPCVSGISAQERIDTALAAAAFDSSMISEEGEYSDATYDQFIVDSNGVECRHTETSFDYGVETTVEDGNGDKYSGYWWTSDPFRANFHPEECGRIALERANAQKGSEPARSGKYNMVIESGVASKMVSPILAALNAYSIQQNNSFLRDSLGKQVFPEGMTIMDRPLIKGQSGSRLFDSEGVAAHERPLIEKGVVKEYFVNTYMSGKLGMEPTLEEAIRPVLDPWPRKGLNRDDILKMCGKGILVTDFNGGNCDSATGDFSYGVEGFYFEGGKIVRPVSGMLATGNFLKLWNNLIAAGEDWRPCMSKLIPTLAFAKVDFNG